MKTALAKYGPPATGLASLLCMFAAIWNYDGTWWRFALTGLVLFIAAAAWKGSHLTKAVVRDIRETPNTARPPQR